jgi:predicted nucleic acid-binding protein
MEFISSDTNVWLDFELISHVDFPFKLPYKYLMNEDAVHEELLAPPDLGEKLLKLGLVETELSEKEFYLAEEYMARYTRLSKYDCVALAIAKCRGIILMTGDMALRKAAQEERVEVIGTIGVLDRLVDAKLISLEEYLECLERLSQVNSGKVRLPAKALEDRINKIKLNQ